MQTFSAASLLTKKFVGVDSLRRQLTAILDKLPNEQSVVVTQHGKPQAVLLDLESYIELQEQLADSDLKLIKRVNEAVAEVRAGKGIPAEKVFQRLGI